MRVNSLSTLKFAGTIALVSVLALIPILMSCIGDRGPKITYFNKTNNAVWINLDLVTKTVSLPYNLNPKIVNEGPIETGTSKNFVYFSIPLSQKVGEQIGNYVISAITLNGTIIYQRIFTWTELRDSGWRVDIE